MCLVFLVRRTSANVRAKCTLCYWCVERPVKFPDISYRWSTSSRDPNGVPLNSIVESLKPVNLGRVFVLAWRNATEAHNVKKRLCSSLSIHHNDVDKVFLGSHLLLVSLVTLSVLGVPYLQIRFLHDSEKSDTG